MTSVHPFWKWMYSIKAPLRLRQNENNTNVKLTHTTLDGFGGGSFVVEDRHISEFLNQYAQMMWERAQCLSMGMSNPPRLCMNELRSPVFAFFFDLDLIQNVPLPWKTEALIYATIQDAVSKFYPGSVASPTQFDLIITAAPDKSYAETDARFPGWQKYGRHGHMYALLVNDAIAATLREGILLALEELPELARVAKTANPWNEAFDEAVYHGSGLRMTYANKAEKCSGCKNDKVLRSSCVACMHSGHQDAGRAYTPYAFFRQGKMLKPALDVLTQGREGLLETVRHTTIRRPLDALITPGFKPAVNFPAPRTGADAVLVERQDGRTTVEFAEDFESRKKFKDLVKVTQGSAEWMAVQEFMRHHLPVCFQRVQVASLLMQTQGKFYHALLKGINSTYCMNIQGQHRNNTAYFVFMRDGVSQKCHCKCDTHENRRFGLCKKFESQKFPLPKTTQEILFPTAITRTKSLLFDDTKDQQLKTVQGYGAVKSILFRLSELMQSHQQEVQAQVEERKLRVEKPGKVVSGGKRKPAKPRKSSSSSTEAPANTSAAPPRKRRKVTISPDEDMGVADAYLF